MVDNHHVSSRQARNSALEHVAIVADRDRLLMRQTTAGRQTDREEDRRGCRDTEANTNVAGNPSSLPRTHRSDESVSLFCTIRYDTGIAFTLTPQK